jgi:triacylglycerol lipase
VAVVIIDSDSRAVGFSLRTGYYLAHCSLAAYGGTGNWPETLALGDSIRTFQCDDFHGFVAAQKDMAIVAFRGTESIGNALTDAETALIRHEAFPGLVHLGFSHAADTVYPTVRVLLRAASRGLPIWVTGHSLGGAMATLVAYRLAAEGFPVRAVYTFGSPRPGDRNFRDAYPLANYRFVNDNDLVPPLPLRWCYRHAGDLKLLTHDGTLLEDYSDWKDKKRELIRHAKHVQRAHRHIEDPPLKLGEFDWLADHFLDGYLAGIASLLPRVPRRRHPDYAGVAVEAVPLHYIDEPADPTIRRPRMLDAPHRPSPVITQSELVAAFVKPPERKRRE